MSSVLLKKGLLVLLTLLSFQVIVYSQTYQAFVRAGDKAYAENDFNQSVFYYKSALELDSTHMDIAFNFANSCRRTNDYKEAIHWYAYVNKNSNDSAFSAASFWLALMKKTSGKYKEAGSLFQKYLKTHGREATYYTRKAQQEVKACATAEKLARQKAEFVVENAGPAINTPGADFNGVQVNDSLLYFSSVRGSSDFSQIYASKKENKKWQPATQITFLKIDSSMHIANSCFAPDGKAFYCTGFPASGTQGCGLYRSFLKEGQWSPLARLNDTINAPEATTTQPSLIVDAQGNTVLYFASNRPGGYGKMDLWYCIIQPNGTFGPPTNLGPVLNTEEDEVSPFSDPHSDTFYFSSEWHSGLGGFDVFKTRGGLNQWMLPENMGSLVNSGYNDLYYTIYKDQGSLTSNRPGGSSDPGSTCCNDIYLFHKEQIKTTPVSLNKDSLEASLVGQQSGNTPAEISTDVKNKVLKRLKNLPPATVYFNNDFPEPRSTKTTCAESYAFYYKEYMAVQPLYLRSYGQDVASFFSNRVKKGFEDLEAFTQLLQEALEAGLSITLKIEGYCSPLTTSQYNHQLAQRRIASLKNYFNSYSNGALKKFMDGGDGKKPQLIFVETFHGEAKAPASVSDQYHDTKNSIYNPAAAAERKVEIQILEIE